VLFGWLVASTLIELVLGPQDGMRTFLATNYAPFFVAGALCSEIAANRRSWPIWAGLAISGVLCIRQGVNDVEHLSRNVEGLHPWVGGVVVACCLAIILGVALGYGRRIGRPWMLTAGLFTYPLYLVHQQVGYAIQYQFRALGDWAVLAISLIAVTLIAWLGHVAVERPASKVLLRRLRPSQPSPAPTAELATGP
jgi:peptidoglycan/LPS O-acetylase OafA/YrhL